jgi:hypothetical protein
MTEDEENRLHMEVYDVVGTIQFATSKLGDANKAEYVIDTLANQIGKLVFRAMRNQERIIELLEVIAQQTNPT